jgi:hypothetical protein
MRTALVAGVALLFAAFLRADGPKGTIPLPKATLYSTHSEMNGAAVGATLLTADQVRDNFASNVDGCCVVVEIALYPSVSKPLNVSLNDFVLKIRDTDVMTKPSSAKVVAASLVGKAGSDRDVKVSPSHGTTSSRGYDPVTGTSGTGITQTTSVIVGVSHPGAGSASSDEERKTVEAELTEKGIPEGTTSSPVAGYVYFHVSPKRRNSAYQLEYTSDKTKVALALP